ncbi:MAG: preprotein translocase subunit SecB [Gammaproteobacteria bacterium]
MKTPLQEAIECLQIRDVFLRRSAAWLADGFDPKYDIADALEAQFKHVVMQGEVLEIAEDGEKQRVFRVYIDLGTRFVVPADAGNGKKKRRSRKTEPPAEPDVKAQIEAVMVAEYLLKAEPRREALDAFAQQNASYHVWPYWREFVMSQCSRMNLPKLAIPTVQFPQKRTRGPDTKEEQHIAASEQGVSLTAQS